MDFREFADDMARKAQATKAAIERLPLLVETEVLEFIDDNFRNQSWEGSAWAPSKGTILVKSGDLRRDFQSEVSPERVRITNEVRYAVAHNEGVDKVIEVKEHERAVLVKVEKGSSKGKAGALLKKTGTGKVKAHKRHMKLPKRQFAPTEESPSKTLNKSIPALISSTLLKALNP